LSLTPTSVKTAPAGSQAAIDKTPAKQQANRFESIAAA
jgi:hypothetical protein